MIPNQWYVVMSSDQIGKRPVGVTRMGEKLVFWRDGSGQVSCLRDRCAHRGVALSKGRVLENGQLQCPFHGFEYDASGTITRIPANGKNADVPERFRVHSYPTHEAHDWIWIWWGESPPDDLASPPYLDDLVDGFVYGQAIDPWDTHYSRVIENQLDVVHLPFVHHNTIGRGNRTLVEGPGFQWVDDHTMYVYVYNKVDDGSVPRQVSEVPVPDPTRDYKLELVMPNLWENRIAEDVRVMAAFVPVDDEHTLMYMRFYQRFMTVPVLGKWLAQLSMFFNLAVAHQDRRVVVTQQPKRSSLRGHEQLIQGDRPVLEYRRKRQAMIERAKK